MSAGVQRPASNDDGAAWRAYWQPQGMPWRTEPEIDEERQRYLSERRAVRPDIEKGIYPFRDENGSVVLRRSDVEWLLEKHEEGYGPVVWDDPAQRVRWGLDLRGANLSGVDLRRLPLARLRGGLNVEERTGDDRLYQTREDAAVHLEEADLTDAHLEQASLSPAHLERAILRRTHLSGADLFHARLEGATLTGARLDGADLSWAFFDDNETYLKDVILTADDTGSARLAGAHWGEADLSVVNWSQLRELGDERLARKSGHTGDYEAAVRANRRLAAILRDQGLNEDADSFAYRAQLLQRQVYRRQGRWGRAVGSWFLDLISGYGYQPMRSVISYLLVVTLFGLAYWAIGLTSGHTLAWNEAGVVSLTAFHGRGFFATAFKPGDPQAALAAIEAVIGLLIEITFIATFTQRFFAR